MLIQSTDNFKNELSNVIEELSLSESFWNSLKWKSLFPFINQEVLTDAFEKHDIIRSMFPKLDIITRNCKSITRVEKKMTEQRLNRENYFKVVSDFIAVRVNCDVDQIREKIGYVKWITNLNGGDILIRGQSSNQPNGGFMNSKFVDITQYVYVYLKEIGYVIEFQIGHEFASHTFAIDSALRDNPNCGKIDLWDDGLYDDVKTYLLNEANGDINNRDAKSNILIKANDIHQNNIPDDLLNIFDKL